MSWNRRRLDQLLVERGLAPSRARAQGAIRAGHVRVGGHVATKPAVLVGAEEEIVLDALEHPYVSRAALKLVHALDRFGIAVEGCECLDVGASTGGFTQVLLERGARHVTAMDVGHGQLAPMLARDARVTALEGLNARDVTAAHVPHPPGLIVCDVSFISLRKALPAVLALAAPGARLVALIKPQFEAGRENVGKGGIVRDGALHEKICRDIADWLSALAGWHVHGVAESPIEGGDGNKEFLIAARHEA